MQLTLHSPSKSLNKAYLKEKVGRKNIELFKQELTKLFEKVQPDYSEDTLKDFVIEFLRNTWYNPNHVITVNKERKDFSIHTGKATKDPVAVIAEIKKVDSLEMMTEGKPNVKALHELVLYYLKERIGNNNNEIKYLLATDINNWILIDANEFDKKIYRDTKIRKLYEVFVNDGKDNPFFYDELRKILSESEDNFGVTFFDLKGYKKIISNKDKEDDRRLVALYKILSPTHLLKLPFANDSNSLDKSFYAELLHIIGLEEIKEGSKKIIQRKKDNSEASLLENAIIKLKDKDCLREVPDVTRFGLTHDQQYYNVALELCITWINRILFLKLLEAQLYIYNRGDKDYLFLNNNFIHDFDELNNLFFQVLAEKSETRRDSLQAKFNRVPYLNSSLFERTNLERKTIDISTLDNKLPLPLHNGTVLKDDRGKRRQDSLSTLSYLFSFLDSYDFASEGNADIQEENKTLINASVLGLIFEKINGYKDGSFFTPGFITMYMCRETLRRAVIQKFNEANGWNCTSFEELKDKIEYQDKDQRQKANDIINSITICDPAVGSGHFLVSALNELIAIKHDLKILQYRYNAQRIREYTIEIANDELIIQDTETEELFEYTLNQKGNIKPELQHLQETLFHEKETLIENCLFGVDINANSVKICSLRLWIELLKNAYYTKESEYTKLETLPNIDINIKKGNSLVSRFNLDADLSGTLQKSKWTIDSYKIAVQTYRNAQSKEEKREMEDLIETIKKDFRSDISTYDPINKKLSKLRGGLNKLNQTDLFSTDSKKKTKANKELEKLSKQIEKLEIEKEEIQNNAIYNDAFEWRFEFPEVLNTEGKFIGFDVVIGNPPYIRQEEITTLKPYLRNKYQTFNGRSDIYVFFYENSFNILRSCGLLSLITSNKFFRSKYGIPLRDFISKNIQIFSILDFGELAVFEEASTFPMIFHASKQVDKPYDFVFAAIKDLNLDSSGVKLLVSKYGHLLSSNVINGSNWTLGSVNDNDLLNKLNLTGIQLKKLIGNNIYSGIKTGFNNAFWINNDTRLKLLAEDPSSAELIKRLSRGDDIRKWHIRESGLYIIYTTQNTDIKKYPAIENYLSKFKIKLEKRASNQKWFQLQQPQFKNGIWDQPKIIYPDICKESRFAIDFNKVYADMKGFIFPSTNYYLLGILNSTLIWWFLKSTCAVLGDPDKGGRLQLKSQYVEKIPIATDVPNDIQERISLLARKCSENFQSEISELEKEIDQLVYKLYDLTPEEIKIVEESSK